MIILQERKHDVAGIRFETTKRKVLVCSFQEADSVLKHLVHDMAVPEGAEVVTHGPHGGGHHVNVSIVQLHLVADLDTRPCR